MLRGYDFFVVLWRIMERRLAANDFLQSYQGKDDPGGIIFRDHFLHQGTTPGGIQANHRD
jgi:hypothetical protein